MITKDEVYALENAMWQAAKTCDKDAFSQLVSADAVMLCGGARCSGTEYAEMVGVFGIEDYEITEFEMLYHSDLQVQVYYIVRTIADSPENADLAGMFRVTSTWEKRDGAWLLIFNMDQRIYL